VIFSSLPTARKIEYVERLLRQRKTKPVEFHKYFDEPLSRKPFPLATIYAILESRDEDLLTTPEIRAFVEKAHLDISEYEYAHLKYSPYHNLLRQRIQQFENLGEAEKAAMKRLTESFDKYDEKFASHKYFANEQ
jgi:hypothetical protein